MLGIDRHEFGACNRSQRLHNRAGRNEALFVGQRQSFASAKRGHRDRKASEANHTVDHYIGVVDQRGKVTNNFGKWQRTGNCGALGGVGNDHKLGSKFVGLGDESLDRGTHTERHDLVLARFSANHIESLSADRTC